jgi:hypothetical protein
MPENLCGYWSAQTVDLAVGYLSKAGHLEFKKVLPPAVVPAAPVEDLGTLPDGSPRLPITLPCPSNATVAQARDYLARIRQQQQPKVRVVPGFKSALR